MPIIGPETPQPKPPEEGKKPELPYEESIGRAIVSDIWRRVLEDSFKLPLQQIAQAILLSYNEKITLAEALKKIREQGSSKD